MNRTLVIVKPDAVERGLVGDILGRLERKGLRLVAVQLRLLDAQTARRHYAEHVGREYFDALVTFITRSPVVVVVVEGPDDTWRLVRQLMGDKNPADASPGTIRGDLASRMAENLIHGSDSSDAARREIEIFFPELA